MLIVYYKYFIKNNHYLTPSEAIVFCHLLSKTVSGSYTYCDHEDSDLKKINFELLDEDMDEDKMIEVPKINYDQMSSLLNLSLGSVFLAVRNLVAKGYMRKIKNHNKPGATYRILAKEEIIRSGYFQLATKNTIVTEGGKKKPLCGEFLVLYSYLHDRAVLDGGDIKINIAKLAYTLKICKGAVYNMIGRMIENDLVERLDNGSYRFL